MGAVHSTASPGVTTEEAVVIAGFPARCSRIDVGGEAIALCEVADLERPVREEGLPLTVHLAEIAWR